MTADMAATLVEFFLADSTVNTLTAGRVGTVVYPEDGYPAVQIGPVQGVPRAHGGEQISHVVDWQAAVYVHAGRRDAGRSDVPDTGLANVVALAVVEAARGIQGSSWESSAGVRLARASVVSAAGSTDPDTGGARFTVTLSLTSADQPA